MEVFYIKPHLISGVDGKSAKLLRGAFVKLHKGSNRYITYEKKHEPVNPFHGTSNQFIEPIDLDTNKFFKLKNE